MKERYLRCYERYSAGAPWRFLLDAALTRSKLRRLSLLNRHRDYLALAGAPERLALHRELNRELLAAAREWESYDYGEGYFYQGLAALGITGLRDTDARVAAMELRERLSGLGVLEIGCNTGFLSLAVAGAARRVVGFDLNPHLVRIGTLAAGHLGREVELSACAFEELRTGERFDAVLSFANHSTYDRNIRQPLEEYFDRCRDRLAPGGRLLFESHPPQHEGDRLEQVIALIATRFDVESRQVLDYGSFLDRGRTFLVAKRR